jgi:predicted Zn-dependent protease with MMP-like domain
MGDRHGRLPRSDGSPRRRPAAGFRAVHRARFEQLLASGIAGLPEHLRAPLTTCRVTVEDVPPVPAAAEHDVPLARYTPRSGGAAPQLVVYRRALELRAEDGQDLAELAGRAAGRAVADALGLDADGLDPPDE